MIDRDKRGLNTLRTAFMSRSGDVVLVTVRELRLMLGLLVVLFLTSEVWRYVGRLPTARLIILVIAVSAAALLVVGLRHTLGRSAVRRATIRVAFEVIALGATLFLAFVGIGVASIDVGTHGEALGEGC